jgi:ribonuclease P protein subunit RPR2
MAQTHKQRHQQKPREHTDISLERIAILFAEAEKTLAKESALSKRYISLARKIAMKYKVRLPTLLKRSFCKQCNTFLKPSTNCTIRLNQGHVVYHCLGCGNYQRFPYHRKESQKANIPKKPRRKTQ